MLLDAEAPSAMQGLVVVGDAPVVARRDALKDGVAERGFATTLCPGFSKSSGSMVTSPATRQTRRVSSTSVPIRRTRRR